MLQAAAAAYETFSVLRQVKATVRIRDMPGNGLHIIPVCLVAQTMKLLLSAAN